MQNEQPPQIASAERETYLAEVSQGLQSRLSPLATYEQIEELRQHLNAMSAAYEEMGLAPAEAMHSALAKFGRANTLAKGILEGSQEHRKLRVFGPALEPAAARSSLNAFLSLIAFGMLPGFILAKSVEMFIAHIGGEYLSFFATLAIGGYASCIVVCICWSFPRMRPAAVGFVSALSMCALLLLVVCSMNSAYNQMSINSSFVVGIVTAGYILGFGMAHAARWLRLRMESNRRPSNAG